MRIAECVAAKRLALELVLLEPSGRLSRPGLHDADSSTTRPPAAATVASCGHVRSSSSSGWPSSRPAAARAAPRRIRRPGTAPCLTKQGFTGVTTNPVKVGFIAGFADNGGILAKAPGGNVVTIAFAADASGAAQTEQAFKAHATGVYKRHINDVMETQRNAVLVWTTTPTQQQVDTATGCLGS